MLFFFPVVILAGCAQFDRNTVVVIAGASFGQRHGLASFGSFGDVDAYAFGCTQVD